MKISIRRGNSDEPSYAPSPRWAYDSPLTDIFERPGAYVLMIDLPGIARDHIHLELFGDTIAMRAETSARRDENAILLSAEIVSAGYNRRFRLAADIDREGIQARYDLGVLTVVLPKRPSAPAKEIHIQ